MTSFMVSTFLLKNVYPKLLSVTPTLHIGNGCIPGSTGNGNPIGSEPGATRRKRAIIKSERLNANEVNLLQKTDI